MSKHKVTRYDVGGDVDEMEEANKRENLDTEAGPKAMPRRPISRTPVAAAAPRKASTDDRSNRSSLRGTTRTSENYGNEGKGDSKYRKQTMTPESQAIERVYPEQYLVGGPGAKTMASAAQNLARTGTKEAPAAVSAARGALDRAMSAERAAPKTGDMSKINDALKAFKNKPAAKPTPKPKPRSKTPAEREAIGRADTMDEYGAAMKRGGSVKKMASGGSASSRGDGIAQRGKTRGTMLCGGGMAKGRK